MFQRLDFSTAMLRLLLAMLAGGAIGYGRSKKERPAGLRTYMIISIGAAMTVLLSLYEYEMLMGPWKGVTDQVGNKFDAGRMVGQAITGIGFLGAGIIIKVAHQQVKGLTTAAGLWVWATGIIGLAIGSAYYELGLMGTVLVLLAETAIARLGGLIQRNPAYAVELLYNEKTSLDQVLRLCKDSNMAITNLKIHTLDEGSEAQYIAEVALRGSVSCENMLSQIRTMPASSWRRACKKEYHKNVEETALLGASLQVCDALRAKLF